MGNLDLLPCPFCGGDAEITQYGDRGISTKYDCLDCGCSLETGETFNHGARWNNRATPQQRDMREADSDMPLPGHGYPIAGHLQG